MGPNIRPVPLLESRFFHAACQANSYKHDGAGSAAASTQRRRGPGLGPKPGSIPAIGSRKGWQSGVVASAILRDALFADLAMPYCCICHATVDRWTPHPHIEGRSEFMKLMQTVGSDLSVFSCPACGCTDRDRHLWLYLDAIALPPRLPGADVLHLAPEAALERLIAAQQPGSYVRGDLHPYRPGHLVIDAQALQFADASFDLVICNHVLEHVACPELALQECRRVLRPGGVLIAQTPYSPMLKKTFERLDAVDPGFATLFYGQADHVRLFGADIGDYFRNAGFRGELLPHEQLLADIDPALAGCNAREPLFAFYNA